MDIFKLYRNFWDFTFANPEKFKPNDIAIYCFAIEHCNRLGWKEKFGFPTLMAMEAVGIKSYSVYKKHFDNLVENGFFEVVEYSKNQYSSNIIALKENYKAHYKAHDKAHDKALDKATVKHLTKHLTKHVEYNNTNLPYTNLPIYQFTEKTNFSNSEIADLFDKFLSVQERPKNEIQIEALVKKLNSFPSDKARIDALETSIRAGYADVYLPKDENSKKTGEQPEPIFVDGKRCIAVKNKDHWVYPDIYAVEINREANTALLTDGTIQPLTQQEKSFNEADFRYIKKVVYQ